MRLNERRSTMIHKTSVQRASEVLLSSTEAQALPLSSILASYTTSTYSERLPHTCAKSDLIFTVKYLSLVTDTIREMVFTAGVVAAMLKGPPPTLTELQLMARRSERWRM